MKISETDLIYKSYMDCINTCNGDYKQAFVQFMVARPKLDRELDYQRKIAFVHSLLDSTLIID